MYKNYRNQGEDKSELLSPNVSPVGDLTTESNPWNQSTVTTTTADYESAEARLQRLQHQNEEEPVENTAPMRKSVLYARRYFRNKLAVVGLIIFIALIAFAVIGPFTAKWSYTDPDFLNLSTPPSSDHWFGTSAAGTDLYAMTIHGLGRSLTIAIIVSVVTTVISAIVGTGAALLGGLAERAILAMIHFLLVIPSFLIIALLVSGSGGNWQLLIVVLIAFGWIYFARVIWSMALSIRERDFVRAARYMGVKNFKILTRHMIPNIGSLLIINLTLGVVSTVMSETGLSFLGLGVKVPDVSLGTLLSSGANSLESSPWEFYFPAGVLTLLTVAVAFIADGLRDALDPNSAAGGQA